MKFGGDRNSEPVAAFAAIEYSRAFIGAAQLLRGVTNFLSPAFLTCLPDDRLDVHVFCGEGLDFRPFGSE
jgi:hypothetical protein